MRKTTGTASVGGENRRRISRARAFHLRIMNQHCKILADVYNDEHVELFAAY